MTNTPTPAVAIRNVTKRYGDIVACDGIDLDLRRGEVHGILGENGAGKSTLMRILIGLVTPDSGEIAIDGSPRRISDPQTAAALGIGMVHQHFSLVDELRVWENVVLGDHRRLDRRAARALVGEIGERYGLGLDPDALVGDLTAGFRQRVEIVKCLRRDPDIVIFDEPTSVLTPQESEQLFAVLRTAVTAEGKAVALVSHKLDEVLHATDVVTILRRGRVVDAMPTRDADARTLAQAMVGRPVSLRNEALALGLVDASVVDASPANVEHSGPPALRIAGAVDDDATDGRSSTTCRSTSTPARSSALPGSRATARPSSSTSSAACFPSTAEPSRSMATVVETGRAGAMGDAGIGLIPEDRHDAGCVLELSVADNLALDELGRGAALGRIDRSARRRRAQQLIAEFGIDCAGPDAPFGSLSGGNQQRVVLARELTAEPTILVAAQPCRGLDVAATEFIGQRLRATADRGDAVLLISNELEEILALADRIVVVHAGRIRR